MLRTAINLIRIFALLGEPFIPTSAQTILNSLQLGDDKRQWPEQIDAASVARELQLLTPGHAFVVPDVLFPQVTKEQVAEWKDQFSGKQPVA